MSGSNGGGRGDAVAPTVRLDERAFRTEMDGGPTVLSERMDSLRSVAIGFWFRQGRIHESEDELGVSHLLEHMVFKGTGRRSAKEIALAIERVGGSLDAYTTHEATCYQARVPAEHLPLAIDVLADMTLEPALRQADLELERSVVLEEIASIEEAPEEVAFEAHASMLYGGHPYGEPIIGTRESVEAMSRADLLRTHEASYRPSNLVIAAVGAVEHDYLLDLVRRRLPGAGHASTVASTLPVSGEIGVRRIGRPGGRQTHVVTGGLGVPYGDPLRYAVVATSTALGAGMSSRLFQRIREEKGLAYSVYSFHCFFAAAGHVGAYVGTRPEVADRAHDMLMDELDAVATDGLRRDELEDTRTQLKGQILISLESPTTRMNRLAGVALFDQPYRSVDDIAAQIDAVDDERSARAAGFFHPDRAAVVVLSPEPDAAGSPSQGPVDEPPTHRGAIG